MLFLRCCAYVAYSEVGDAKRAVLSLNGRSLLLSKGFIKVGSEMILRKALEEEDEDFPALPRGTVQHLAFIQLFWAVSGFFLLIVVSGVR